MMTLWEVQGNLESCGIHVIAMVFIAVEKLLYLKKVSYIALNTNVDSLSSN